VPQKRLLGGRIFAHEVVIPEDGYSHNPLRNMWQLEMGRALVGARLGLSINQIRAAGARADTHVLIVERVNAPNGRPDRAIGGYADMKVSFLLFTVTLYANRAHNLTRSP